MKHKTRLPSLFIIVVLFLSACNLPSNNPENASSTAAAQTVVALLSVTPGTTVTPSLTPLAVPTTLTPLPLPVSSSTPSVTPTTNCNVAQFVSDVTIPDGSVMTPGQTFTKKWRIKNIGSCTWTGFSLVFDSGESMGGPASKPISTVTPGQEVDLEVNLTAPASPGAYRSYWRINTNGNVLVPIVSGYQGKSFYVDIKVQNPVTITNTPTLTPTPTPTGTTAPPFAVTSVTFSVSGTCPNFSYTYSVTTNGAGTVNLHRVFSDGGTDTTPVTMTFTGAGTQTSPPIIVFMGTPATTTWVEIYIDSPNRQQFGRASFTCP